MNESSVCKNERDFERNTGSVGVIENNKCWESNGRKVKSMDYWNTRTVKNLSYNAEELNCCQDATDARCFVIPIPPRDRWHIVDYLMAFNTNHDHRFYSRVNLTATCMNVVRSTPVCASSKRRYRKDSLYTMATIDTFREIQQYNSLTSYVDASNVYGSETEHAAVLRTYRGGLLASNTSNAQLPTFEALNIRPNVRRVRYSLVAWSIIIHQQYAL